MGVYDEFGLDANIDKNSFTAEHAAMVFNKAAEAVKTGDSEIVDKLLNAGFKLLPVIIGLLTNDGKV